MMKKMLLLLVALIGITASAQVKMGNNPTTINSNALLELESTNKGILLPRVALTATDSAAPLSAFVSGMAVYNTATAGTGNTAVAPGFYVCDGTKWVSLTAITIYIDVTDIDDAPPGTQIGQVVYNTNDAVLPIGLAYWDGSKWIHINTDASMTVNQYAVTNIHNAPPGTKMGQVIYNISDAVLPIGLAYWDDTKWVHINTDASTTVNQYAVTNIHNAPSGTQTGQVIYNTSASVLPIGLAYWDGTKWIHINTDASTTIKNEYITNTTSPPGTYIGQVVYNTNVGGDVNEGPAYWDGTQWISMKGGSPFYKSGGSVDASLDKTNTVYRTGAMGIGSNNTPDASAKLDVNSTTQGFLMPRMTKAQRDAIANPARGLMVYCLDCPECTVCTNDGDDWNSPNWNPPTSSSSVSLDCNASGFSGVFFQNTAPGTNKVRFVLINNSFSNVTGVDFSTAVSLSGAGAAGLSIAPSQNTSVTVNSGATVNLDYTFTGTPTALGTLTASFGKLGLICSKSATVIPLTVATFNSVDCMTATPATGGYIVLSPMNSYNTKTITVNVATIGSYSISTNTNSGITFSASGTFTTTGSQQVVLTASGTLSASAGSKSYTVTAGTQTCNFSVNVLSGGASLSGINCTGALAGSYNQGTAMTTGNTKTITATVIGSLTGRIYARTNTVNGVYFEFTGTVSSAGANSVVLMANGTPQAEGGPFTYTLSVQSSGSIRTCTFTVTYGAELATYQPGSLTCTGTLAGSYNQGVAMTSANKKTININVATVGPYTIQTNTSNGIKFSASGDFAATGAQDIILTASGTPTNPAVINTDYTFTLGSQTCTFSVPTFGKLTIAACPTVTLNGNYYAGVSTAGNTATLAVNVTNPGSYSLNISGGGSVVFTGSGVISATGPANIVLNATGTYNTAGGVATPYSLGGQSCTLGVNYTLPPATFTGGPTCTGSGLVLNGTYTQNVAMTGTNTKTITVNVNSIGTYTITTDLQNGVTFSKTGTFSATGEQTVVLAATGTPTAATTSMYTITGAGTPSCSFNVTYSSPVDLIRASLSTSVSAYDAAATNTLVEITAAEYNNILSVVPGTSKKGSTYEGAANVPPLTSYGTAVTYSINTISGSGDHTYVFLQNNDYVVAFKTAMRYDITASVKLVTVGSDPMQPNTCLTSDATPNFTWNGTQFKYLVVKRPLNNCGTNINFGISATTSSANTIFTQCKMSSNNGSHGASVSNDNNSAGCGNTPSINNAGTFYLQAIATQSKNW